MACPAEGDLLSGKPSPSTGQKVTLRLMKGDPLQGDGTAIAGIALIAGIESIEAISAIPAIA